MSTVGMETSCCRIAAPSSASAKLGSQAAQNGRPFLPALPNRVRRSHARTVQPGVVCSFGAEPSAWGETASTGMLSLSHLASLAGFALGALFVGRELAMEQSENEGEVCSTCNGTGRVPCFCQRWSDGEAGCSSCGNTGMTYCKDCNGGGTMVPVARAIPIYAKDENKYRGGPYQCQPCQSSQQ